MSSGWITSGTRVGAKRFCVERRYWPTITCKVHENNASFLKRSTTHCDLQRMCLGDTTRLKAGAEKNNQTQYDLGLFEPHFLREFEQPGVHFQNLILWTFENGPGNFVKLQISEIKHSVHSE